MTPVALLRAHSRHAPWNARGLAAHVTALVDAAGIRPTNASARVAPSARSVRFYVASGLLDRPEGAGTAATYNYRHLLQLLAIKIRQREGATLEGIKKAKVVLPAPKILQSRIDNEHTYVYSRNVDILAKRKETLESQARVQAEKELVKAATDAGILDRANRNASHTVEGLVRALGYEKVEIVTTKP